MDIKFNCVTKKDNRMVDTEGLCAADEGVYRVTPEDSNDPVRFIVLRNNNSLLNTILYVSNGHLEVFDPDVWSSYNFIKTNEPISITIGWNRL